MKVVIIGPAPPPMGGISIHIKRIMHHLEKRGIECVLYNESETVVAESGIIPIRNYKKFLLNLLLIRGDLFHVHSTHLHLRMLLGFYALLGKKIMMTVHGDSLMKQLECSKGLEGFLLRWSLQRVDRIVCVNAAHAGRLVAMGIQEKRVYTIPAYIKPVERHEDATAIPPHVQNFISSAGFLISANGSVRLEQGKDLYGIDQLLWLTRELAETRSDVRVLFCVLGVSVQSEEEFHYYEELKRRIRSDGLEGRFLFYEAENTEFYPILQQSRLFIRPTLEDGYGVSIAEALQYKVPAIASNVCTRPEGTIEYEAGDAVELLLKVKEVMHNEHAFRQQLLQIKQRDHLDELLCLYHELKEMRTFKSKGQVIPDEYVK